MGNEKNKERSRQWLRFRRWLLGIKGIPKHILALLLFSLPFVITMTVVTIMTSIDHRERTTPFGILDRYLANYDNPTFFSLPLICFSSWYSLHSLHFCTIIGQLRQGIRVYGISVISRLPHGILGTLAFSNLQVCKVCKGLFLQNVD